MAGAIATPEFLERFERLERLRSLMILERRSEAVNEGEEQLIGTSSEEVFDADAADAGAYFWLYNNSDTRIWVSYSDTAVVGTGIPLDPGGYIHEDRYAGVVSAIHDGTGDKALIKGIV